MPKPRIPTSAYASLAAATRQLPSLPQTELLDKLFISAGYDTRAKRNDWLSLRVGRQVRFLDDLSRLEASRMIGALQDDLQSSNRPEAGREVCSECGGAGKVCQTCGKPIVDCTGFGHGYSPVRCGVCEGRRFEA